MERSKSAREERTSDSFAPAKPVPVLNGARVQVGAVSIMPNARQTGATRQFTAPI